MKTASLKDKIRSELENYKLDYALAKSQAKILDELLGFDCTRIEQDLFAIHQGQNILSSQQFWYGLDIQSMQTPYSELVEMVKYLKPKPGDLWLDLGAAYGRMGIVLAWLEPMIKFVGYEYVQERVDEGNRIYKQWDLSFARLEQKNLASQDFKLELADLYFVYDFGSKADVYCILEQLKKISINKPIQVIARGRGIKNWIYQDCPWLYDIKPPEHFNNWSLFRT